MQALKSKADASFEEVLAQLNRAKAIKGFLSVRDGVLHTGAFIMSQLPAMQSALGAKTVLSDSKFVKGLQSEVRS